MPAFVFLSGSEWGEVDVTSCFGVPFPRGEPVMVTDPHAVMKLRGNRFFREVV